jgi:hypothetical protein
MVNNIEMADAKPDDRILKAAQLLGRLKARHGVPVIAFSGYFPESFSLSEELRKNGIHTFFPAPFDAETFLKGLRDALRSQRAPTHDNEPKETQEPTHGCPWPRFRVSHPPERFRI